MSNVSFLSEKWEDPEKTFQDVMLACYRIKDLDRLYYNRKEMQFHKVYSDHFEGGWSQDEPGKEWSGFWSVDNRERFLHEPDERNPLIFLDIIPNKKLYSIFSGDKVHYRRLTLEFAKEYLKINPNQYLYCEPFFYSAEEIKDMKPENFLWKR